MKLIRLSLENFKGCRALTVEPLGENLNVYGDNGTGKTTIADALFWLLFGKDSLNRADFEIKTLVDGQPVPGLSHSVEGTFDVGERIALKRAYREVWESKRGAVDKTFAGHTTDYWINSVPVQKKEFDARIASICDEKTFRLLTDPNHFCSVMPWQDRRKALLALVGDVSDADVIASNPALAGLPAILEGRTVEDHRKVVAARKREVNDELKALPSRIDEATRAIPGASKPDPAALDAARAELAALQERKAEASAGGEAARLSIELREVKNTISELMSEMRRRNGEAHQSALIEHRESLNERRKLQDDADAVKRSIQRVESHRQRVESDLKKAYADYAREKDLTFSGDLVCPACSQALPEERVAEATERFNEQRAARLARLIDLGKGLKIELADADVELESAKSKLATLAAQLDATPEPVAPAPDPVDETTHPDYPELAARANCLSQRLEELRKGSADAMAAIDGSIREVQTRIQTLERAEADRATAERLQGRILELKARQKELGAEAERIEGELYLTEEFVRTQVSLVTDRINDRFRVARFKLFDVQVNGAIAECCEATVNGVPYGSLNHGSRLNVGLDCIDALAEARGFAPFVVIDNAESVTQILPTIGQQIRLVVSAADAELRFQLARQEAFSL